MFLEGVSSLILVCQVYTMFPFSQQENSLKDILPKLAQIS
jgi:hypothetical protein